MGEKSRGNWAVGWCSLKGKGCIGSCEVCVRKSEARFFDNGEKGCEPRTVGGKVVWVESEYEGEK